MNNHILIIMEYQIKYMVSSTWWEIYKNPQSNSINPVDNNSLIEFKSNNSQVFVIKPNISSFEYVLVEKNEWNYIKKNFGGGPEIEIFIFDEKEDLDPVLVDVYVIQECLCMSPTATFAVSKHLSLMDLKDYLCTKLFIEMNRYEFFIIK